MKTRLGTRLEEESKRHPNTKERSESKGQFGTFGVLNGTLKGQNFLGWALAQWLSSDDKAYPFLPFRKRIRSDSNPNNSYLFFRVFWSL